MSPDANTPATVALVQAAVGAENAACFDLSAACSGFVYALDVAEKMLTRPGGIALVADRGEYMQLAWSSGEVIKTSFL